MKFYVTTPIYYVNDFPHIGHSYTTVAADVLARWHRLQGKDVFFLTGTDEHGAKISEAAAAAGQSPKKFCDNIVNGFKSAWKDLNISNDFFIRTTDPEHEKAVQYFLSRLNESGDIYLGKYEGLYCVHCEKYLSPGDLNEEKQCPYHKQEPAIHSEENYFFRLSKYQDKLLEIISSGELKILPVERRNEILGKLKANPLEDISISRAALEWGIPLPFDSSQTAYVWIDALLNYVTAIGFGSDDSKLKKWWPAEVQLMAKDILWFHSVIWPAMLLAVDLPTPKSVFSHGFFTINGQKMSKTVGNVIRPSEMKGRFGTDASRYLSLALFPFGTDGDISWAALTDKYNTHLANNLGNLVSRTITMLEKYFGGIVPAKVNHFQVGERAIIREIKGIFADIPAHIDNIEFSQIIEKIQKAIDAANSLIEITAPWKMAKESNPDLAKVMFALLEAIGLIAIYLVPFMPEKAQDIWERMGESGKIEDAAKIYFQNTGDVPNIEFPHPGNKIVKGESLFPRIIVTP